jgi:hypothetical protein
MVGTVICGAGGVIDIQKDYRLVIRYKNSFCKLLRFAVARDGSINFSAYLKGATEMLDQVDKTDEQGSLSVSYNKGRLTPVDEIPNKNILKVNYHASGFVHYGIARAKAKPLREVESEYVLAMLTFMHPSEMGLVASNRIQSNDMVATFEIRENYPLFASITLAKTLAPQTNMPRGKVLWTQWLKFNSPDIGEMDLRVYIFEGGSGQWPPECGCLVKGEPA